MNWNVNFSFLVCRGSLPWVNALFISNTNLAARFSFASNNWDNSVSGLTDYSCRIFFWKKWSHFSAMENYNIRSRRLRKVDAVSLSYKGADKAECRCSRNASQREVLIRLSLAGRRAVERMLGGECLLEMVTS